MIATVAQETEVAARFDALGARFKSSVPADDLRLEAVVQALGPRARLGRVLDLGCGKGRFADRLEEAGATVVGLDLSAVMLRESTLDRRVRASARRLPFASASFDGAIAIEVLEHMAPAAWDQTAGELRRVLRPDARLAIVDKSAIALDPIRPWLPALAVKQIDQRRGRWMYNAKSSVRERWFWPGQLRRILRDAGFLEVESRPIAIEDTPIFRLLPRLRRFALWSATAPGMAR